MKKKRLMKFMIVCFLTLFLSGCTSTYNMAINADKSVNEELIINIPSSDIKSKGLTTKEYFDGIISKYKEFISHEKYDYSYTADSKNTIFVINKKYDSISDYSNSLIYKKLFEKLMLVDNSNGITIKTYGNYYYDDIFKNINNSYDFPLDNININIQTFLGVNESNADSFNSSISLYKWHLDKTSNPRYISINLNNKTQTMAQINTFLYKYRVSMISVGIVILIICTILISIRFKNKKENKL